VLHRAEIDEVVLAILFLMRVPVGEVVPILADEEI
jgi:hypothetical protein